MSFMSMIELGLQTKSNSTKHLLILQKFHVEIVVLATN